MGSDQVNLNKWKSLAEQILGEDFFDEFKTQMEKEGPSYNVYSSSSEIIVLINLPYVRDMSQVKLNVKEQELNVKGDVDLGYDHMHQISGGIFSGSFELSVPLPQIVNTKKVNAQYQRGILHVQLFPKLRKEGHSVQIIDT